MKINVDGLAGLSYSLNIEGQKPSKRKEKNMSETCTCNICDKPLRMIERAPGIYAINCENQYCDNKAAKAGVIGPIAQALIALDEAMCAEMEEDREADRERQRDEWNKSDRDDFRAEERFERARGNY